MNGCDAMSDCDADVDADAAADPAGGGCVSGAWSSKLAEYSQGQLVAWHPPTTHEYHMSGVPWTGTVFNWVFLQEIRPRQPRLPSGNEVRGKGQCHSALGCQDIQSLWPSLQ